MGGTQTATEHEFPARISVRMSVELREWVAAEAKKRDLLPSTYIRFVLKRMKTQTEERAAA